MKTTIAILVLIAVFCSCKKAEKTNKMAVVDWLIGTWENNMEKGRLSESWEKVNDSTFSGKSFFIKDNDTLSDETIILKQKDTNLFFIPTVKGQNNGNPVVFKMTSNSAKQIIFENKTHDFPQKITYTQINKDSLVAEISGIEQGKPSSESYPMKRK